MNRKQLALPIFLVTTLVLLLIVGWRQQRSGHKQQMAQPILGGNEHQRQGPWPECLQMEATKCQRFIETYAEDTRGNIQIVSQDAMVTMDFRPERVRIFVDADNIVTQIPRRG